MSETPFKVVARDDVPFVVSLQGADLLAPFVAVAVNAAEVATEQARRATIAFTWRADANLYDASAMRFTGYISTGDGSPQPEANWAHIRVPVRPGQILTWYSNTDRPDGSSFLKADLSPVTGSQDATAVSPMVPQTRTAPSDAAFLAINLKSNVVAAPTEMMVNLGSVATPYVSYDAAAIELNEDALPASAAGVGETLAHEGDSANLYNDAAEQDGHYLSTGDGSIQPASGWAVSGFMPIVAAESYTISAEDDRESTVSFFDEPTGLAANVVGFSTGSTGTRTVTAPADAAYMVVSTKSPSYPKPDWIMANRGVMALPYQAWSADAAARVKYGAISKLTARQTGKLVLNGEGATASYVESGRSGHVIRNEFVAFPVVDLIAPPCRFNLGNIYLDGAPFRVGGTDDIAPDIIEGVLVGGNHGYLLGSTTVTAHGKDASDEGSIWSQGGSQFVLVRVEDANTLLIAHRTANGGPAVGTLTHVSGATHTSGMTVSAMSEISWYPPHANYSLRCFVDGVENFERVGEWGYENDVQFVEVCDILTRASIIAWWIANDGAQAGIVPSGTAQYRLITTYRFDRDGQLTIHRPWNWLADTSVTNLWGLQVGYVSDPDEFRVPGAVPFAFDGDTVDYGIGVAADRTIDANLSIDFGASKLQVTGGEYAHRVLSLWTNRAFAAGILPVGAGAYDVRRANVATRALQLYLSGKQYFRVIDKGIFTANAGTGTEAVLFRHVLVREAGKPLVCPVRLSDRRAIVYIDWAEFAGFDQVELPADLTGRTVTVLDSRNATLLGSGLAAGSLTASVTATGDHAYLVLNLAG